MATEHPRVFISHASEDKVRFVMEFAIKLRARGIDAWVDEWEMLPGDSLVEKIFEEGIKNAEAMIVVLSKNSVQKPWVREELNAGFMKRINGKCKLIPVVLDDCQVPEALKSTIWQKIKDISSYNEELDRIVSSIFGLTDKPPLGNSPVYARLEIDHLPGISKIDTMVFKSICDLSLEKDIDWISTDELKPQLSNLGISEDNLYESLDILAGIYYLEGERYIGSEGIQLIKITTQGFEQYATAFLPGFSDLVSKALISIVNNGIEDNEKLAAHLSKSRILIDYILDILNNRGLIKQVKTIGGGVYITEITAQGKRAARSIGN